MCVTETDLPFILSLVLFARAPPLALPSMRCAKKKDFFENVLVAKGNPLALP
jgi:hypothetical protein